MNDDISDFDNGTKEFKGHGWVQKVYRRIVGTKRHETTAMVPVELTAKDLKK